MPDIITLEADFDKFLKAFDLYRKSSSHSIEYVCQKQMLNLSIELFDLFRQISATQEKILAVPKKIDYRVHLFKTQGDSAKDNSKNLLKRVASGKKISKKNLRAIANRQVYAKLNQGSAGALTNKRWIAIRNEILARVRTIGGAAGGFLAWKNKTFNEGSKLIPKNKKQTNYAQVEITEDSVEITMANTVPNADKINQRFGNIVQNAVDNRTNELLDHIEKEQVKKIQQLESDAQ